MDAKKQLHRIPHSPGVYIMKNGEGETIYIGKAKDLRKRVGSYFHKTPAEGKTAALIRSVETVETIMTDNENEALLLESNLIKKYRPKYNIELKDTQKYPYIKVTSEKYPRIIKTRIKKDDGALYFGPYTSVKTINRTIRTITELFPIRRCSTRLKNGAPKKPCLNYHLGRCEGPCAGNIDKTYYDRLVHEVVLFLRGCNGELLNRLKEQMQQEASNKRFERALILRERYRALKDLLGEQKVTTPGMENEDIVGISRHGRTYSIVLLKKRSGRIIQKADWIVQSDMGPETALEEFLDFYYEDNEDVPAYILLPFEVENAHMTAAFLQERFKRSICILVPKRGVKKRLISLASKNAAQRMEEEFLRYDPADAAGALKTALGLDRAPLNIEAFDISTILGYYPVASMVRFSSGRPDKRSYRKYRIRYSGMNDTAMMEEAVARRYQRLLNEKKPLPDLVLVDGGVPQANAARRVLTSLGLGELPVAGLAKREEVVFVPGRRSPLVMEDRNPALRLLMAVRNEAHRFAHDYQKNLRITENLKSILMTIPGIGPGLAGKILSVLGQEEITIESLGSINGIGKKRAVSVYRALKERVETAVKPT
ncbi:MAG: excinuclease ABC subunit UvrC [Spirochaetes bacterium]|nr:excinuclease ABC subunit UvrC [Spirochaetota bacterium]